LFEAVYEAIKKFVFSENPCKFYQFSQVSVAEVVDVARFNLDMDFPEKVTNLAGNCLPVAEFNLHPVISDYWISNVTWDAEHRFLEGEKVLLVFYMDFKNKNRLTTRQKIVDRRTFFDK
jgi:hypothetical protein